MDKIFNDRDLQLVNHKLNNYIQTNVFVPENKWGEVALVEPVGKMSGVYYVEKDTGYFELADKVTGDTWADSRAGDWSSSSYSCDTWGRGWYATKSDLEEADSELNLLQKRVAMATRHVDLRKEYECFKLFASTASFAGIYTAPAVWVHTTTNKPNNSTSIVSDVVEARRRVGSGTNYTVMPNKLFLGGKAANIIGIHNDFYDDDKYTKSDMYKQYGLPEYIQGCKTVIVNAVYEPKVQTQKKSSRAKSKMISDFCAVAYIGSSADNTWMACFQRHEKRSMPKENNAKFISGEVNESYQFKVLNAKYAVKIDNIEG